MKAKKNIKSFLREEDGKAIKKSLLVSSLWLVLWFGITNSAEAWSSHSSGNTWSAHSSCHSNHNSHSSY